MNTVLIAMHLCGEEEKGPKVVVREKERIYELAIAQRACEGDLNLTFKL